MGRNSRNSSNKAIRNKTNMHRTVKNIIDSTRELKNCATDFRFTNTVAGTGMPISQAVIQGDNVNQRSGMAIHPVRLDFNYSLLAGVGSTNSFHRLVIFQDRLNQAASVSIADVLDGSFYDSTYNILNKQQNRFKILHDKIYGVVGSSNSAATHIQLKLKLKGKITYNGTAGNAGDNGPGAIFAITLTDAITVSTATVSVYASLFYHDA